MSSSIASLRQALLDLTQRHADGQVSGDDYLHRKSELESQLVQAVLLETPGPATKQAAAPAAKPPLPKGLLIAGVLGALAVASAGYWWTSADSRAQQAASQEAGTEGNAHELGQDQIVKMTEGLAARLQAEPNNPEGWTMLGRSWMVLGRVDDALAAYEQSFKLNPDDVVMLADYADAMAAKQMRDAQAKNPGAPDGNPLAGEPMKLIERALKIDPNHIKSLMLAGTHAYRQGDFASAVKHWDRAAMVAPDDHPLKAQALRAAEDARAKGSLPPAKAAEAAGRQPTPVATVAPGAMPGGQTAADKPAANDANKAVSGTVSLAPSLKSMVSPDDAVFIFARPADGTRVPLASIRKQVKDLPFQFTLNDQLAMSPNSRISSAQVVIVGARVSKSGQAMPKPGDMEGLSGEVKVGSTGVVVEISKQVP